MRLNYRCSSHFPYQLCKGLQFFATFALYSTIIFSKTQIMHKAPIYKPQYNKHLLFFLNVTDRKIFRNHRKIHFKQLKKFFIQKNYHCYPFDMNTLIFQKDFITQNVPIHSFLNNTFHSTKTHGYFVYIMPPLSLSTKNQKHIFQTILLNMNIIYLFKKNTTALFFLSQCNRH